MAKFAFGIQAVQAGQKSNTLNAQPQLIANSTTGKFIITSVVSKALGIAVGENVMFLNNFDGIEQAIAARVQDLVDWASEVGVDIETVEGRDAAIKEFGQWYISKGVKLYDPKGRPVMVSERFTKEDKQNYLNAHRAEIVEANREALVEQFGEMSDEELAEKLTIDMVESPKFHGASGSKTATTSAATGVGVQLNFTDTAIWGALKADLDEPEKKNRIFSVGLTEPETIDYNNGKENVSIVIYPINYLEDVDPIQRGTKE